MIRSVGGRPVNEWKTVPDGFRVVREPPAAQYVPDGKGAHRMPLADALRIGGALLYWRLIDWLIDWRPRREVVRRLPMGVSLPVA